MASIDYRKHYNKYILNGSKVKLSHSKMPTFIDENEDLHNFIKGQSKSSKIIL